MQASQNSFASNKKILFYGATHMGRVRAHNEDSYGIDPELGFFVIADGMGGHGGGDVASTIAVEEIINYIKQEEDIDRSVILAHQAVLDAAKQGKGSPSMGSTIVTLQVKEDSYKIAWVGDSRAYLWNGKVLRQLTQDHSYVQELISAGVLSEKEARNHPQRSVITRAIGSGSIRDLKVDIISGKFLPGHKILLCSDGLTSELGDEEIKNILSEDGECEYLVWKLINAANNKGGRDNITVILVSRPGNNRVTAKRKVIDISVKGSNRTLSVFLLLTTLLLFLLTFIYIFQREDKTFRHGSSVISKNWVNFKHFSVIPGKLNSKPLPGPGKKNNR